jgi:hypothetical protein
MSAQSPSHSPTRITTLKSACVWCTSRFTTRPAPQVKDLGHGQLLLQQLYSMQWWIAP